MKHLKGLKEYIDERYALSVFDRALGSEDFWNIHCHGHRTVRAKVTGDVTYDITIGLEDGTEEVMPKINVKFLYPFETAEKILPLIKLDKKVKQRQLPAILKPHERYFVKNKSLYPLMKEKEVVFFTLMEGEVLRGLIADFSKYDITVHLKGGVPVTLLRHSILALRNKKGRSFLKSDQKDLRDWQKSELYVSIHE